MSPFLPAPTFPWGSLIRLKGDEDGRREPVSPTRNTLDSVLPHRPFKWQDRFSHTPTPLSQSARLPLSLPPFSVGFHGWRRAIQDLTALQPHLLLRPFHRVRLTRVHSACESFNHGAQPSRIWMWISPWTRSTSGLRRAGQTSTYRTGTSWALHQLQMEPPAGRGA